MAERLAIFASGQGTTMESGPINAIEKGFLDAEIATIILSSESIPARDVAEKHKLRHDFIMPTKFGRGESFKEDEFTDSVNKILDETGATIGILMGWKAKLTDGVIKHLPLFMGTHPGWLPETARGFDLVPAAKERRFIDLTGRNEGGEVVAQRLLPGRGWDEGTIIGRRKIPIFDEDTPEKIQERGKISEGPVVVEVLRDYSKNKLVEVEQEARYMRPGEDALLQQADVWAREYVKNLKK